ncbi:TPA: hypothetical protein ACYLM8_006047, partial [Burkholderia lata]
MPCPAAVTSARLPCNLMSNSPEKAGQPSADWHKGLKVQPIIGSDFAFVTESGFSIYPGGEIGRLSKDSAFDGARERVQGFVQPQYRRVSRPVDSTRPARQHAKLTKKSCSRQGLNGMRTPS